jgi:hypothetical protein
MTAGAAKRELQDFAMSAFSYGVHAASNKKIIRAFLCGISGTKR